MKQLLSALAVLLVVTSAMTTPAAAGLLSPSGDQQPEVVRYGADRHPSVVLTLDNDSMQHVDDWVNESDQRTLITADNDTNIAVVAAPKYETLDLNVIQALQAGAGLDAFTTDALAEESYVRSASLNYELEVDPVDSFVNESTFEGPTSQQLLDLGNDDFETSGVAFEGNDSTMAESRAAVGADNTTRTGAGVTVAVIDTGANTVNGQLYGNGTAGSSTRIMDDSKNFISNATVGVNGTAAIEDGNGHGSWTASAIGANATGTVHDGVAPDASLLVLKALADDGSGSTADITRSIRYAADHDADVISMSLGSPIDSQALDDAVAYARDQGSVVVAAAGNSRQTRSPGIATPADSDGVLTVGATTGQEPASAESAYFSQVGPDPSTTDGNGLDSQGARVDIAAPGMSTMARVASTSGTLQNSTLSGTSMATPLVAGSLAAALEAHPDWSEQDTRAWALNSTRAVPNAGVTEVGEGMIAADRMVDKTQSNRTQTDARTSAAVARDLAYRRAYDTSGGYLDSLPLLGGVFDGAA